MTIDQIEKIDLNVEPVIISLNTEVYMLKCQLVLLATENMALKARLAQFAALAVADQAMAVGA